MLKKILVVAVLVSSGAMAGLKVGVYSGVQSNGQGCQVRVKSVYFLNNTVHPLNERVDVEAHGVTLTLQHPPIISSEKKMAYFNHDMFQGIIASQTGGIALELKVAHAARAVHDDAFPTEFHLIQHVYKNDQRSSLVCIRLQKTQ